MTVPVAGYGFITNSVDESDSVTVSVDESEFVTVPVIFDMASLTVLKRSAKIELRWQKC